MTKMRKQVTGLIVAVGVFIATPLWAQEHHGDDPHAGHRMPMPTKPSEQSRTPDRQKADISGSATISEKAAENAAMGDMDMESMQDKSAVSDPHAGHNMATPAKSKDQAANGSQSSSDIPGMNNSGTKATKEMETGAMNMGSMQGGSAPADARDPHAYSGGFTLVDGPYVLAGQHQLHLMDEHNLYGVLFDRLEYSDRAGENPLVYDAQAWYGLTYDRLVIKAEGDIVDRELEESRTELLWGHAIAPFWDSQLGVRFDSAEGADRTWLAFGVQGLAPYWFEVDASAYLGESGRTALRMETEYDLLLSQRLILQPRVELNLYGREDEVNGIGSGLSDATAGLRLRYEFSRQFAPYIGVEWTEKYGNTADLARESDHPVTDTRWVVGVRMWF